MSVPYIRSSDGGVTLVAEGRSFTVPKSSANFRDLMGAIERGDSEDVIAEMASVALRVKAYSGGALLVDGEQITYKGLRLPPVLEQRVLEHLREECPCDRLLKFFDRLIANPSRTSVQGLYAFLEHRNIPITERGTFLAYKAIQNDWTDKYTGKYVNAVGSRLVMPRLAVDDDSSVGCSYGFHVGNLEYVKSYAGGGDRVVIVEVDPANVVSVPKDSNCGKIRTCEYTVIGEYQAPLPSTDVDHAQNPYEENLENGNDDDDDDDDDNDGSNDDEEREVPIGIHVTMFTASKRA